MRWGIDGIPDVVPGGHSLISDRNDPAKAKLLFYTSEVRAVGQAVIGISREKFIGNREALIVHKQSHLYDRIGPMLFREAFAQEVILCIGLEILVCNAIVDQAGIPAIRFPDPVIEPYLQVFPVLIQKRKTAVNIIQGVVCFFKETFTVFIGRFL